MCGSAVLPRHCKPDPEGETSSRVRSPFLDGHYAVWMMVFVGQTFAQWELDRAQQIHFALVSEKTSEGYTA